MVVALSADNMAITSPQKIRTKGQKAFTEYSNQKSDYSTNLHRQHTQRTGFDAIDGNGNRLFSIPCSHNIQQW